MSPSISDREISIIKGMLRMGYKPSLIQSYFTRPDRLVNPARIQEIKADSSPRSAAIVAATDEAVAEFLDEYARQHPGSGAYAPPEQEPAVALFKLGDEGRITILSSEQDLQLGSPDIRDIYEELRLKVIALGGCGHNSLGTIHQDVEQFNSVLPEDPLEARIVRIFMKGSGLKSKLASYQAHRDNPELYPVVSIDETVYPLFEDVVKSFVLLVSLTPAMATLEDKGATEKEYASQGEALEAIQPAIENVDDISDQNAADTLKEQVVDGLSAQNTHSGLAQRAVAFSSVRNFAITIFSPIYHAARYVLGNDKLPEIVKSLRNGVVAGAGKHLYDYMQERFPAIIEYIKNNAENLSLYAEKIVTNPHLHEFINSIIEILKMML